MPAAQAGIARLQRRVTGELVLRCEVPLVGVAVFFVLQVAVSAERAAEQERLVDGIAPGGRTKPVRVGVAQRVQRGYLAIDGRDHIVHEVIQRVGIGSLGKLQRAWDVENSASAAY